MIAAAVSLLGWTRPLRPALVAIALGVPTGACDDFPRDSSDTFEQVRGGTMAVGVLHNPPWAEADGPEPGGVEPDIVRELARSLGAEIEWHSGSERDLLEALENWQIALVIGGLVEDSPWSRDLAFTRPYVSSTTVVAGPTPGALHDLDGLRVAVPRASAAARWVEDAGGTAVPEEEAGADVELSAKPSHELRPGENVKLVLHSSQHVVAVPPGENRWLIEVDSFFRSKALSVIERIEPR